MTIEETKTAHGAVNWLASSPFGPRICFAPEGKGSGGDAGEGEGGEGGEGAAGSEAGDGTDAGQGDGAGASGDNGKKSGSENEGTKGSASEGEGEDGGQQQQLEDWRAGIQDEKLREFAGKFASPSDLAKTAFEFRQKLSKGLQPPGDDASDEEKAAFRKALKIPDDPKGYEFEMPEGVEPTEADQQFQERMAQVFHEAGIPAPAAKALNKAWNEMTAAAQEESQRAATEGREASHAALKKEWGKDFDANFTLAKRVIKSHASAEFVDMLEKAEVDGTKLGDHPDMVRLFGNLGRRMDESGFIGTVSDDERTGIQEQIDQLMRDNPPGTDKYRDPAVQKKLRELNEKLHGTSPAVGAGGRTV